jgi:7-carboxy-7-deazaguanine synthase
VFVWSSGGYRSGRRVHAQERTRTSKGFYSHQHLKLARLPISPPGRWVGSYTRRRRKVEGFYTRRVQDAPNIAHPTAPAAPAPSPRLRINEVFHSIQGESTWAGCPCVFIRLTGCHLRCRYCDTEYAFREGAWRSVTDLVEEAVGFGTPLVEITGGEPLLQPHVHDLVRQLCDRGRTVLIETSGACDISSCDPRSILILDLKTPGSGECGRNLIENLARIRPQDELKFVVTDRADFDWATTMVREHDLAARCRAILMSAVFEQQPGLEIAGCKALHPRLLAEWILESGLPVRMQTQLHKLIWDPSTRGV